MVYRDDFVRQADTSGLITCDILGSDILVSSMDELAAYIARNIEGLSGDYLTVSATNEIVMSLKDPDFFRCQNGGVLTIPDGAPLVTYGRKQGYKEMERITGPDLMLKMFEISRENGLSHYFYGNTEETLAKMKERLDKDYPGIKIAGMRPSLYRDLSAKEDEELVENINAVDPDIVWFCLGAPKGNFFAARHQGVINALMISVGAGFDYFTGSIQRAPEWMQKHDLEWLYRLKQEPKRLIKRYGYNIPYFLWHAYVLKR
ncbi:MAG: WecB/TagA/CpsF family glycosyltransferase [Mogibacterium sp.]|nr:WecB/TagA/CpsF family glycosyltransferase [Mogibacterium sp.]